MKRKEKTKDTNEPKGKLIRVGDFLPSPKTLFPNKRTNARPAKVLHQKSKKKR
jgi:hypothetical protein